MQLFIGIILIGLGLYGQTQGEQGLGFLVLVGGFITGVALYSQGKTEGQNLRDKYPWMK